ncbi:F-box/kelch-repeat protein At3g23880-like [Trifolium pratense]|uniref:F-box/kelch-repeat protein At3g23880-like n=1 Tax=Trifolium pratense TaxID=57577 RepID=UPI001E692660|nr:F-box/kelch-repeat protein At3g23880-like [Trifolium pratense]
MAKKMLYLPFELIIEILLRLPVKSLLRFKSVCKSWFSLISKPNFANSHFQITVATRTSRILTLTQTPPRKFQSIDFEINSDSVSLNHNFLPPPYTYCQIKGSCRGFICLYSFRDIWIWNPSNRFHKQIPLSRFGSVLHNFTYHLYGFGYDQSRDDYVVVLLTCYLITNFSCVLEFFSLRDNTWNEIGKTHLTYLNTCQCKAGSFINGVVHWKLFEMPLPNDFHHSRENYGIWVFGEFLSLWVKDYPNNTTEIWVMKEYKLHSSWTKTLVICAEGGSSFYKPVCRTKSGDIIGKDHDRLVKYNDKGQLLEYLHIDRYADDLAMYTESLFSLPGEL